MKLPAVHGWIERRILINFTANPNDVQKILPAVFRPKLYYKKAVVGICLIRLKNVKPKGLPDFVGVSSENGAHRIAVEWEKNGQQKEGVYVPRRDTSLKLNTILGGRVFPGKHHLAKFNVQESGKNYHIDFTSSDDTQISIDATEVNEFNPASIFQTLENASAFFQRGEIGFSPNGEKLEGLRLCTHSWKVHPMQVHHIKSSFFENESIFPKGSVVFDNALLMKSIEHEWIGVGT